MGCEDFEVFAAFFVSAWGCVGCVPEEWFFRGGGSPHFRAGGKMSWLVSGALILHVQLLCKNPFDNCIKTRFCAIVGHFSSEQLHNWPLRFTFQTGVNRPLLDEPSRKNSSIADGIKLFWITERSVAKVTRRAFLS